MADLGFERTQIWLPPGRRKLLMLEIAARLRDRAAMEEQDSQLLEALLDLLSSEASS